VKNYIDPFDGLNDVDDILLESREGVLQRPVFEDDWEGGEYSP
jgi:hypothetical protein